MGGRASRGRDAAAVVALGPVLAGAAAEYPHGRAQYEPCGVESAWEIAARGYARRPGMTPTFVAIDFETADYGADSACAVGLVRVEGWTVVARESRLIRPPRRYIRFTDLHGITWAHVEGAPIFADVWPRLCPLLDGAKYFVAHNAGF